MNPSPTTKRMLALATFVALALVLALPATLATSAAASGGAVAPVGYAITPLASVAVPTAIAWGPGTSNGPDLYATTLGGTVDRIHLTWTAAGPVVLAVTPHATGLSLPLGLAFQGHALFVTESGAGAESGRTDGRIVRIDSDGTRTTIVDGLPNGLHNTNHMVFGPDGRLYANNGNPNDSGCPRDAQGERACVGGAADAFPYSGAVLAFDVNVVTASPATLRWKDTNGDRIDEDDLFTHPVNADFNSKVEAYAWGFRNNYGLAFSPSGDLYVSMNGANQPDTQDGVYRITTGGIDHGFPFCVSDGPAGGVGSDVFLTQGPHFPAADCSAVPPATALLGWNVCATGVAFPTEGPFGFRGSHARSVYVAECGPFAVNNALAQTIADPSTRNVGHKITRVELDAAGNAVAVEDFLTGLALPTDVLFGPDGAMYVADAEGILRVAATPETPGLALPAPVPVVAAGFNFLSPAVTVTAGSTVEWIGAALPHTVTTAASLEDALAGRSNRGTGPDAFDRSLPMNGRVSHTFDTPGTVYYYCVLHVGAGMVGTVHVV